MIPVDAAVEQLRRLASGEMTVGGGSIGALIDSVHAHWPADFTASHDAAAIIGRPCPQSARDLHSAGLLEASGAAETARLPATSARLRYHARWLLALVDRLPEAGPSVSIIIPIYNRAWLAKAVVENCLAQTHRAVEIVVVDDGSSDGTAEALAGYGDRIKLVQQANGGAGAARNAGIAAATGDFVQFLDSDNLLEPTCIAEKVAAFARFPDAELCYCAATEVALFGAPPSLNEWSHFPFDSENFAVRDLMTAITERGFAFLVTSVMMPRWAVLESGGFDADMRSVEDSRYWFRLALRGSKAIGIRRRLFLRCIMADGLNTTGKSAWGPRALNVVRNVRDALGRPELWPQLANYLGRPTVQQAWGHGIDAPADALLAASRARLIETILRFDRARPGDDTASLLPILIVLWMYLADAAAGYPDAEAGPRFREDLVGTVFDAAVHAPAMSARDRDLWRRGSAIRPASAEFRQRLAQYTIPPDVAGTAKFRDAFAIVRDCAGVAAPLEPAITATAAARPRCAIVLPVLDDPEAAEVTIESCLAHGGLENLELLVVDRDQNRLAYWTAKSDRIKSLWHPDGKASVAGVRNLGVQHTTAWLVRLAMPGDTFSPGSLDVQAEALREAGVYAFAVEVPASAGNAGTGRGLRSLADLDAEVVRSPLSAMLLPLSLLRRVGGFDPILGSAHEDRFRLRLAASGVPALPVPLAAASLRHAAGGADAREGQLAALSDLSLGLRSPSTWQLLPGLAAALPRSGFAPADRTFATVSARLLDYLERSIVEIAGHGMIDGEPVQVAFGLALAGLVGADPLRDDPTSREARRVRSALISASRIATPHVAGSRAIQRSAIAAAGSESLRRMVTQAHAYIARHDPGSPLEGVYDEFGIAIRRQRETD